MQLPEARFVLRCNGASALSGRAGSRGMAGAGRRRLSRAQSCFPTKENTWGLGLRRRRPPAKQQGPGSQGQASPASPYGERRAWGENGLHCFPEPRRVGGVVCCPRRGSLCRMQLPEALFGPSLPWVLSADRPSWLSGLTIRRCRELWCRLQTRLGSHVAVALV